MKKFTESETEKYYDSESEIYRSFWDKSGVCHWGLFKDESDTVSIASSRLTQYMIDYLGIDKNSNILNIGCGDGEVDFRIVNQVGCHMTGIDLSKVKIKNAKRKITEVVQDKLKFFHASATDLPFKNESFTHVISQSVIYHIPDKKRVFSEIRRVLINGGGLVFDDLVKPKVDISIDTKRYVYERLLFDTEFSFESYKVELVSQGFEVVKAVDESINMKKTYQKLIVTLEHRIKNNENKEFNERYRYLIKAYKKTIKAVELGELGWAIYNCKKV